ncbi:MAG: NAD(P)H-dependent flavin oxidoreductase [Pseudoxanthomonas sp.]
MSLQSLLGIDLPIIQAPMAGSQDHVLAVAVSNAGGLGSLPCAMLGADALRAQLAAIRTQTDRPCNVNFFCHTTPVSDPAREARWRAILEPYYRAFDLDPGQLATAPARLPFDEPTAELLEEFKPPVISFHFGLPSRALLERIRRWDCKVLSTATTVEEARWLEARGVDAVIAQGLEAGGHRGHFLSGDLTRQSGIFALLPRIVDAVRVPVIAAGGIADHRGVVAALALGASGVQVGTAFLLCPEATTSAVHRAALSDATARHTALTNLFSGRPARGLVNRCMRELGPMNPLAPEFPLAAAAMAPLRAHCEREGNRDFSPLWSGQNPDGCRNIPAAKLTRQLAGRA